jgi:ABC-2 type transport system permease protein
MLNSFVIVLTVFAVAVFAGVITGNSFMHTLAAVFFNFPLVSFFGELFFMYRVQYLYGFDMESGWGDVFAMTSPYLTLTGYGGDYSWVVYVLYFVFAVVLFGFSLFLYYKRKLERVGDSFVFGFMNNFAVYLAAFVCMHLAGLYFHNAFECDADGHIDFCAIGEFYDFTGHVGAFYYAGLIAGAAFSFLVASMIIKRTFRVFNARTFRSFGVYSLLAAAFVLSFRFDLTGFENKAEDLYAYGLDYMEFIMVRIITAPTPYRGLLGSCFLINPQNTKV